MVAGRMGGDSTSAPSHSFVNRSGWREFQTVLAGLRRECPPALPVVVRASWLPETILGQCLRREKRFTVLLNRELKEPQAVEVLCHKWAHALAWNFTLDRISRMRRPQFLRLERRRAILPPSAGGTRCHDRTSALICFA